MKKQENIRKIYRLDNTANLYPAISNKKRPGVFRVSATLNNEINPAFLQTALDKTLIRIPGFSVKLRSGLFWHYFIHSDQKLLIQQDVSNPCTEMTAKSNDGFLMRVRYHQNRIAVEFFHALTDGTGAMIFLKTLLALYLQLCGLSIPAKNGVLETTEQPKEVENSDQFHAFAAKSPIRKTINSQAFHVKGTKLDPDEMRIIHGTIPINALKHTASAYGVSITEYLTAVFMKVLYDCQVSNRINLQLPVKVQVPVNLRKFTAEKTLRNFSAFVTPSINPRHGKYSFLEITELVHHFIRYETTKKHLQSQVAANLRYGTNPFIRLLPLGLKNNLIHLGYKLKGPIFFTSVFSNLGLIQVPEEMKKHIRSFGFILGATTGTNISCAALGYKGNVRISFSRVIKETEVERRFFRFLVERGLPVHVESFQE